MSYAMSKVLAVILAEGQGERLSLLSENPYTIFVGREVRTT
jgi:choline kinase